MTQETGGQRDADHEAVSPRTGTARVVVVGSDDGRIAQYQAALGLAQVPFRTTLDTDEAEMLIGALPLEVLVLDLGVPRLALLQLYSQARSREGGADVQVLFVGQDGDTGPDDHFLPGEPSPVTVSSWVSDLIAGVTEPPALDLGLDDRPAHAAQPAVVDDVAIGAPADALSQPDPALAPTATPPVDRPTGTPDADGLHDNGAAVGRVASAVDPMDTVAATTAPGPSAELPEAPSRRSYAVLVRIGLVLLVLGALLLLVRMEWNPPPVALPPATAPTAVPDTTPTPTGQENAPSLAAWVLRSVDTSA